MTEHVFKPGDIVCVKPSGPKLSFMGIQAAGPVACKDLAGGGIVYHKLEDLIPYSLGRKANRGTV